MTTFSEADRAAFYAELKAAAPLMGERLSGLAFERGLAVTDRQSGARKAIPVTATAVVLSRAELTRRQALSAQIASATLKMSRLVLSSHRAPLVLDGLSPLEKQLAVATFDALTRLISTRVDFFVGAKVQALEVNATIPAMQGYSDIAANTLIEVAGRHFGQPDHVIAANQAKNGSNALALYRALLAGYQTVRPGQAPSNLAVLVRRNDAQLTELGYLIERFREYGQAVELLYPDELSGDDAVRARGQQFDLIYRHLFVRRLEEPDMVGAEYVKALLAEPNGKRAVVLNPPASQVEVKAVFALLSEALEDAALGAEAGLTKAELDAIAQAVPWTRVFRGEALQQKVAADPDRYVLKRSWDYGGRAVLVGRTREAAGFASRVQAAWGAPMDWNGVCAAAVSDTTGGGFIVQEIVETTPEAHVLCAGTSVSEDPLYVDFSAYASVGLEQQPAWGGVCRGSLSHIVNIVGGGGVIPLLTEEVAASLLNAARARVNV